MCKAHVIRFSCNHGVLMSLDCCKRGPCPLLKMTGVRLPQQPQRCYNCQNKVERVSISSSSGSSHRGSRGSSQESLTSASTASYSPPLTRATSTVSPSPPICHTMPKVSKQPLTSLWFGAKPSANQPFSFACHGSDHAATPHYTSLPDFLPHQDHSCPPCQLAEFRTKSEVDVVRAARAEYPNLQAEMLVRDGRIWEDWQGKPTLEKYVDEKTTEDREMWLHVTRKWTQDLKRARILVAEEDGLGLFG